MPFNPQDLAAANAVQLAAAQATEGEIRLVAGPGTGKSNTIEQRVCWLLGQHNFNPAELAFAKLKAFLRAARPRTFDHVCELMAAALGLFMPDECANYVRHCGYRVTT